MVVCEFCGASITSKYNMKAHYATNKCMAVQEQLRLDARTEKEKLESDVKDYKQKFENVKKEYEDLKHKSEIDSLILKHKEELEKLKSELKAPVSITTNNIYNNNINTINNMVPLTVEHFKKFSKDLTLADLEGSDAYAQYMVDYPLKGQVYVKNLRDKKVIYKNVDGKLSEDVGGYIILKNITHCNLDQILDIIGSTITKLQEQIEDLDYQKDKNLMILKNQQIYNLEDIRESYNNMSYGKDCKFKDRISRKLVKLIASSDSGITTT